jgi:DNA-directed RNA polymerase II subunit RPB11
VPELFIRVQTDGTITPKDAVIQVCKSLINQFAQFSQRFTREYELRRMADAGDQGNQ